MVFPRIAGVGLVLLLSQSGAVAAFSSSPNATCLASSVGHLTISENWPPSEADEDLCLLPDEQLSPSQRALLAELALYNTKAAGFFGLPTDPVFSDGPEFTGVTVELAGSGLGPIGASANRRAVMMTFFPPYSGHGVNESIYLHEMGHYLSFQDNPFLPAVFPALKNGGFFQETFADTFALALTDQVITPEEDLPGCLSNLRRIMSFQSYRYPKGYFDETFTVRRVQACCRYLEARPGALTPNAQAFCRNPDLNRTLPEMDRAKLDVQPLQSLESLSYSWRDTIDPHQYGVPLNSFLFQLSRSIGRPLRELVLPALTRGTRGAVALKAYCSFNYRELSHSAHRSHSSFFRIIRSIRDLMWTDDERKIFDDLWSRHGMDRGGILYENETLWLLTQRFVASMQADPKLGTAIRSCMAWLQSGEGSPGDCRLRCERL